MADAVFVASGRDETSPRYYTLNIRINKLGEAVLFRLSEKSSDALKNFDLLQLAICMSNDLIQTALPIQ